MTCAAPISRTRSHAPITPSFLRRIDDIKGRARADDGMPAQVERRRERHEQAVRIDRADTGPWMRRQQGAETRLDRLQIKPTDILHTLTVGIHRNPLEHL